MAAELEELRRRKLLAKDFDTFRVLLLDYARAYFPDRISDFSESSVGGLFLDFAAYVGDVLSFYLDHQFNELSADSAVEIQNIQNIFKTNGVKITGASPSSVDVNVFIKVPAKSVNSKIIPDPDALPIIRAGTTFTSKDDVDFILQSDIDFSSNFTQQIGNLNSDNTPNTFVLSKSGRCISGRYVEEKLQVGSFSQFRTFTLTNTDITSINFVIDSNGNNYYEVNSLTEDTVFQNVNNISNPDELVSDSIKIIPAPYRYIVNTNLSNKKTTLTFGGGSANSFEDDVIPDPGDFAIKFYKSQTFPRNMINPNSFLNTKSLGIIDENVELTIGYTFGGGLSHNVSAKNINSVKILNIFFPKSPSQRIISFVRTSIEVINNQAASGGEDAPSIALLRNLLPQIKNSQNRVVTKSDLLARLYSMPSNFGKIFRAAINQNINYTDVYIISRNSNNQLIKSPKELKNNLVKYLDSYRIISDAIKFSDAEIINIQLKFEITTEQQFNSQRVLQDVISVLRTKFDIKNQNIGQTINISEIFNLIFSVRGVLSVDKIKIENIFGIVDNRNYSDTFFEIEENKFGEIIIPPSNGIFELKFPDFDIIGLTK